MTVSCWQNHVCKITNLHSVGPKYIFFEKVEEVKPQKPKIVWNLSTG